MRIRVLLAVSLLSLLACSGCGRSEIGAKSFTESMILAELAWHLSETTRAAQAQPKRRGECVVAGEGFGRIAPIRIPLAA